MRGGRGGGGRRSDVVPVDFRRGGCGGGYGTWEGGAGGQKRGDSDTGDRGGWRAGVEIVQLTKEWAGASNTSGIPLVCGGGKNGVEWRYGGR